MTRWNERRGISDDLCYLRQAYLFQTFGFEGIRTDIARDKTGHFNKLVNDVGQPGWSTADSAICHVRMDRTGQLVLQYPPGVGAVLALFPEGHQVVPMYMIATLMILIMSVVAIHVARTRGAVIAAAAFGCMALYFMINPAKASYSMAPTMAICAVAGFLTAKLYDCGKQAQSWLIIASIGLLLGLSFNFRVANLLLLAGYGLLFLAAFLADRTFNAFMRGALLGITGLIGLVPTLIANSVNAGSPFATTYGGPDIAPPDLTFSITPAYLADQQSALIIAAIAWTSAILLLPRARWLRPLAAITAINLAINLGYFLSHPVFTQYYLMPVAMLSLWSLLFGFVLDDRQRAGNHAGEQSPISPVTSARAFQQTP